MPLQRHEIPPRASTQPNSELEMTSLRCNTLLQALHPINLDRLANGLCVHLHLFIDLQDLCTELCFVCDICHLLLKRTPHEEIERRLAEGPKACWITAFVLKFTLPKAQKHVRVPNRGPEVPNSKGDPVYIYMSLTSMPF